jgi:hypothetical protein
LFAVTLLAFSITATSTGMVLQEIDPAQVSGPLVNPIPKSPVLLSPQQSTSPEDKMAQ